MKITRRNFAGGLAASFSFFIGGCATARAPRKIGPNDKVNVAIIGCGLIARCTNVPGFLADPRCRVTIACDMVKLAPEYYYWQKASGFGTSGFVKEKGGYRDDICGSTVIKDMADRHYGDKSCREVFDWRDVIADPSVDAVCICTPDHWHAIIAIAAMKAGKHVFCQKPMSLGIREGQEMVRVAKETGVTFQVGNQGRNNPKFRLSEELVFNGYAGKIKSATICIPACSHWVGHGHSARRAPLPKYFSKEAWELWQGPAEFWENGAYIPSIHEPTCWRFNNRYGGGMIPDFGAHEFDQLQRGLGMDVSGPVAIENMWTDIDKCTDRDVFSWASDFRFDIVYANGVRCHVRKIDEKNGWPRQTIFHCEKGDIGSYNYRGKLPKELEKFTEADFTAGDKRFYRAANGHDSWKYHEADFIDGIIENRQCCSPCEVGHRTITVAHLANICEILRVERIGWDPVKEVFTGPHAAEAEKLSHTKYSNGWKLG